MGKTIRRQMQTADGVWEVMTTNANAEVVVMPPAPSPWRAMHPEQALTLADFLRRAALEVDPDAVVPDAR